MCLKAAKFGNAAEYPYVRIHGSSRPPRGTEFEPRVRIRVRREAPPAIGGEKGAAEPSEADEDEGTCGLPTDGDAQHDTANVSLGFISTGHSHAVAEEGSTEVASVRASRLSLNSTAFREAAASAGLRPEGPGESTEVTAVEEAAPDAEGDDETCGPPTNDGEEKADHLDASLMELQGNSSARSAEVRNAQQKTVAVHGASASREATAPPLPQGFRAPNTLASRLPSKAVVGNAGLRGAPGTKEDGKDPGPSVFRRAVGLLAQGTAIVLVAKAAYHAYTAKTPKLPL